MIKRSRLFAPVRSPARTNQPTVTMMLRISHSGAAAFRMRMSKTPRRKTIARFAILAALLLLIPGSSALAQSNGDFRTRQSGNWSRSNTWEEYVGGSWTNSNNTPGRNDGTITIRTGHSVNGNDRGQYDQVVIEAGGELTITQTFRIVDGAGIDLEVYGRLIVSRTTRLEGTATAYFHPGSETIVDGGDRLFFRDSSSATWANGSVLNVNGIFQVQDSASVTLSDNTVFTNDSTVRVNGTATLTLDNSTFINNSVFRQNQSGALVVGAGSVFEHAQDGGRLPVGANTTWAAGSTLEVTGIVSTRPSNLDATYDTFIWDSPGQTTDIDIRGEILGVNADFIINSTGSGRLIWDDRNSATLPVSGDLQVNGGDFVIVDNTTAGVSVAGDVTIAAGSTVTLADNGGTGTLTVSGDLTVNGTLNTLNTSAGTIELTGSGQNLALNTTLTGDIDLLLSGGGSPVISSDLTIPGSVTETSGGLDMGGNALSVENDLTITTSLTNVGEVTFSGTEPSTMTLPAGSQTLSSLVVDKPGTTFTLGSDLTITTSLIIRDGTFDEAGFTLTLAEGATFYSNQPWTGQVTISRTFSQNSDGWRMFASPVQGINYSDLNSVFLTQGATWATTTGGTANLQAFDFVSQGWSPQNGGDAQFGTGAGYIFYAFAQDESGTPQLPTTWTVTGTPGTLSAQGLSYSGDPTSSYNLVGNPGTSNLDWDLSYDASTNIGSSYATWDPSGTTGGGTSGYQYYDRASGVGSAGRYIAPFTAYMVQATGAGASLQPTTSEAAASQTPQTFGKNDSSAPHFQLRVDGASLSEPETILSFGAEATDDTNLFDVERLSPLSTQFATLWSAAGDRRLAFDGRTMETGREIYDLVFATTMSGTYEIYVNTISGIPEHWSATLVDLKTGNELDLRTQNHLTFHTSDDDLVTADHRLSSTRVARFRVIVGDPDRVQDADSEWGVSREEPVLTQNYPNPFNPVTTIRFSLPESAPVRLEIFDMLGRRIQTLVDASLQPGWHEARFHADNLASGMYLYRLDVAGQSVSKRMLLLR